MKKYIFYFLLFVTSTVFSQTNNGFNPPSSEGGGCEAVYGTRNQIRALATSNSLEIGCPYIITGYSRGCLAAAEIVLTATSTGAFSMDAEVLTAFDTDYWEARYDINRNRVIELNDNLGNEVNGIIGNEVDRFAWGRNNVSANIIDNADVYMDCATTATINENEWNSNAYTDLRGMEGVFEDNTTDSYGRIYLRNVTQVDFRRNKIQSLAYVYFTASSDVFHRQNNYGAQCYVRKFRTSTGRWTLTDSNIGRGDIRHYGGTAYCDDLELSSGGRLYMRGTGTQDVRNTTISDLSYVNFEGTGGVTRLWRANINGLSSFYIRAAVTAGNRYYYSHTQSASTYDYRSGTANITMTNNNINSNGYVRWDNIAGTYRIYQNNITARAEHRLEGTTGTHSHYYNSITNYIGRIRLVNSVGSFLQRNSMSGDGRIEANGGNPRVYYCDLSSIGILTLTNYTGVVQRSKFMSDARVNLTGTGNLYASTFGTSFVFNSTNLNHSYITAFGNLTHTAAAANSNRGAFYNLLNNLL